MDLSSDLPCGVRAVLEIHHQRPIAKHEWVAGGGSWISIRSQADPKRWAKLDAELQRDFYHRLGEKPAKAV